MHLNTAEILELLFRYRYLILFPIAFLEGPAVAVVAGFLVAIKFMDFWIVYIILVMANITGDVFYYSIGRLVPRRRLDEVLSLFRIREKQIKKAEHVFIKNKKMAIVFGKIAHAVGTVFLVTAGLVRVPFGEYLSLGTLIELPKALIFLMIGYYFGHSLASLNKAIDYSVAGFIVLTILMCLGYYFMEKYADEELEEMEH